MPSPCHQRWAFKRRNMFLGSFLLEHFSPVLTCWQHCPPSWCLHGNNTLEIFRSEMNETKRALDNSAWMDTERNVHYLYKLHTVLCRVLDRFSSELPLVPEKKWRGLLTVCRIGQSWQRAGQAALLYYAPRWWLCSESDPSHAFNARPGLCFCFSPRPTFPSDPAD